MSSYYRVTRHPKTGKWEEAFWIDDYLGRHLYGVRFPDGNVFDPRYAELETRDEPIEIGQEEIVMAISVDAKTWAVKEQIFEDPVTKLTFQFEVMPDGKARFRVFGNFPLGNREFVFNEAGEKCGSGNATRGVCRPAWMTKVDD